MIFNKEECLQGICCTQCNKKEKVFSRIEELSPKILIIIKDVLGNKLSAFSGNKEMYLEDMKDGVLNYEDIVYNEKILNEIDIIRSFIFENSILEIESVLGKLTNRGNTVGNTKQLLERII